MSDVQVTRVACTSDTVIDTRRFFMSDDVRSPQAVRAPPARVAVTDDAAALLARLRD
jgi:hypothetical protein